MGLLDTPQAAEEKLADAEAALSRLKARTSEQHQKDFNNLVERLRKSVDALSETIKIQLGATKQNSSLDADGLFGDDRIQAASLGGARIYGGPNGTGPIPEALFEASGITFRPSQRNEFVKWLSGNGLHGSVDPCSLRLVDPKYGDSW